MKFAIAALLGASSAIKINQTAYDDGSSTAPQTATTAGMDPTTATTAPQFCPHSAETEHTYPVGREALECYKQEPQGSMYADYMLTLPAQAAVECHWECVPTPPAPGPENGGLPDGEVMCPHGPPEDSYPQCSSHWIVVDHTTNECGWTPCQAEPAFTMPTRDEQIKQFADGFFGHCDMDHDKILTMDELRSCLKGVRKMMKDEAKEQVKMQTDQIMNQTQQQVQGLKQMGLMIYQGATQGKIPVPDGISMSDVLEFLQAPGNFEQVGAIMNGGQDHGNSGDSGDSGPEMCGAVPCNSGDGPAMCGADPCTSPHDIAGGNANGTNGTMNGTYGA